MRFLDTVKGRVKLLHVRDMSQRQPRGYRVAMGSPTVGSGLLDWQRILPAALAVHVPAAIDGIPGLTAEEKAWLCERTAKTLLGEQ